MTALPVSSPGPADTDFPEGVISPAQLAAQLGTPGLVILDCRHDLAQPDWGAHQYRAGHVPGAVFAHLDRDLAGPRTGLNGRHPLPPPEAFAARLRHWGVGTHSRVVAYDASQGAFAARAWWMLRWLGHRHAAVLDGGWTAWEAAGMPVSNQEPKVAPGDFRAGPSLQAIADVADVFSVAQASGAAGGSTTLLLDARAPDRFEGRNETVDPVAGHRDAADVQRLCEHRAVDVERLQTAEALRRHALDVERALVLIPAGAKQVVMIGRLVGLCGGGRSGIPQRRASEDRTASG